MDTHSLTAFIAVSNLQSFSQAAEYLHLTQSAVSKRIQQLEQHLNTKLFDRHNRTVSLTEAGRILLPKAQKILDLISDTEIAIQSHDTEVAGTLALATSHHTGLHRLPSVVREFTANYPSVNLDLSFVGSEKAYKAIHQRQVELALTTLDNANDTDQGDLKSDLKIVPLWQDEMVCVCANNHPLAQQPHLTLADLSKVPAILPEPDTITFQLVERIFQQHGLTLHAPMPTNYLETIKMMITVGMGWSMLPKTMLDIHCHALAWPDIPLKRSLGVIYLESRTLSNAAKAFLNTLEH